MNYTELKNTIKSYMENDFPASTLTSDEQLDTFIKQAEQRIYNTVQFPSLRRNVTGTTSATSQYLGAPEDFLAVYSMAVIDASGSYTYLLNKDVNFIREAYPNPTDKAFPRYYALFGAQTNAPNELAFIFGPWPDSNYGVELHYFYYPVSIANTTLNPSGTSWLGDNFDSVLLYGSLIEAYTFMKGEPDLLQLYNQKYMEALGLAKRLGDGMERQDAYRSGQFRMPVT